MDGAARPLVRAAGAREGVQHPVDDLAAPRGRQRVEIRVRRRPTQEDGAQGRAFGDLAVEPLVGRAPGCSRHAREDSAFPESRAAAKTSAPPRARRPAPTPSALAGPLPRARRPLAERRAMRPPTTQRPTATRNSNDFSQSQQIVHSSHFFENFFRAPSIDPVSGKRTRRPLPRSARSTCARCSPCPTAGGRRGALSPAFAPGRRSCGRRSHRGGASVLDTVHRPHVSSSPRHPSTPQPLSAPARGALPSRAEVVNHLLDVAARRFFGAFGGTVPVPELRSLGVPGAMEALHKWDGRGQFEAFAMQRIQWAVLRGVRREILRHQEPTTREELLSPGRAGLARRGSLPSLPRRDPRSPHHRARRGDQRPLPGHRTRRRADPPPASDSRPSRARERGDGAPLLPGRDLRRDRPRPRDEQVGCPRGVPSRPATAGSAPSHWTRGDSPSRRNGPSRRPAEPCPPLPEKERGPRRDAGFLLPSQG